MLEAKEQIRTKLDIAEVIGEVVALKPAGRGQLKGLCPFHGEKTPSFHVQQERGFYYCFGCQAKGDIFDFVMRTQGIEFGEALQLLGQRAGIEVTPPTPKDKKRRDLFEVNNVALEFFKSHLKTNANAHRYLLERKLTEESITTFELGYAPDSWDALLKYALTKGLSDNDLLLAGLVIENDNKRRYDRFRNRVMFPIKDFLGRVVGFSGRVLDDSLPKYLNTPETDVFKKGELLYGLDTAKTAIRSSGEALVVEGYMDVIALHQTGFNNAVAALGATLTKDQAKSFSQLGVKKLYLAFDADNAGQRAIISGLDQSVGREFLVKAVHVPHGKDPADTVLNGHVEEFRKALDTGLSATQFRFETISTKHDSNNLRYEENVFNELLPYMIPFSLGGDVAEPVALEMRRLAADKLKLDEQKISYTINSYNKRSVRKTEALHFDGLKRDKKLEARVSLIELEVIALLLLEPYRLQERLASLESSLPEITDSVLREFHSICIECAFDDRQILSRYQEREEGRIVFERLFFQPDEEDGRKIDVDNYIDKSLSRLRELYLNGEKETQRTKLLERMEEVSRYLTDPNLPTDQLKHYYAELKEIHAMLAARDAERRIQRVPVGFKKKK